MYSMEMHGGNAKRKERYDEECMREYTSLYSFSFMNSLQTQLYLAAKSQSLGTKPQTKSSCDFYATTLPMVECPNVEARVQIHQEKRIGQYDLAKTTNHVSQSPVIDDTQGVCKS